jgi:precorrin-6Y C5,15-methyltransferase (decarboxylating)
MEVETVSLHGRARVDLSRFLINSYTFILCDKLSVERLRGVMKYLNPHDIEVTIGYKLGYGDEVIEQIDIFNDELEKFDLSQPYVLLIKRCFETKPLSRDSEFLTERGMITKEYKRNLSLQHLNLEPNQTLWDIGAGSGSCAIEAYKRYRVKTILFEKQPQRCSFIRRNLSTHHVVDTLLLEGKGEELFERVEENPDRIFWVGVGRWSLQNFHTSTRDSIRVE